MNSFVIKSSILRLEAVTSALASGIIKNKIMTCDQKGYKNYSLSVNEG